MVGDVVGVDVVVGGVVVGEGVDGAVCSVVKRCFLDVETAVFLADYFGAESDHEFFSLQQRVWGDFLLLTGIMLFPFSLAALAL